MAFTTTILQISFLENPKLAPILDKLGEIKTIAYYIKLVTALASVGGRLEKRQAQYLGRSLKVTNCEYSLFIDDVLKEGVFREENGEIVCDEILADVKKVTNQRESWKKNKRQQRGHDKNVHQDMLEDSTSVSIEQEQEIEQEEELKGGVGENNQPPALQKKQPEKIQFGEFVHLTQKEIDDVTNKHGSKFFDRCVTKLDAWIGSDPTPKRIKNGFNAGATFRSWVINSVLEEKLKSQNQNNKLSNYDRNRQILLEQMSEHEPSIEAEFFK